MSLNLLDTPIIIIIASYNPEHNSLLILLGKSEVLKDFSFGGLRV